MSDKIGLSASRPSERNKAKALEDVAQVTPKEELCRTGKRKGEPRKKQIKGSREQISLTLPDGLVNRLNAYSFHLGVSRNSIVNMAIVEYLESKGVDLK